MSTTTFNDLVLALADALLRDPRVHPKKGDVLDDDHPLVPLTVVAVHPNAEHPIVIVAERREWWQAQMLVRGRWRGSFGQWRREMAAAAVGERPER